MSAYLFKENTLLAATLLLPLGCGVDKFGDVLDGDTLQQVDNTALCDKEMQQNGDKLKACWSATPLSCKGMPMNPGWGDLTAPDRGWGYKGNDSSSTCKIYAEGLFLVQGGTYHIHINNQRIIPQDGTTTPQYEFSIATLNKTHDMGVAISSWINYSDENLDTILFTATNLYDTLLGLQLKIYQSGSDRYTATWKIGYIAIIQDKGPPNPTLP